MKATSVKRLSALPVKNGLGLSGSESDRSNPRYIRITDIDQYGQLREDTYASQPRSVIEDAWVESGDVLIASVGATVGKSYLHKADGEYCFAGYLSRIRPDPEKLDPRFLHYWTQSKDYWDQVRTRLVSSTIENLSASKIGTFEVPTPPLSLQNKIADYLDHETAEIDALTTELSASSDLLQERSSATIDSTFLRRATQWVPLKRFGITKISGYSANASSQPAGAGEVGVLKTGAVSQGSFNPLENKLVDEAAELAKLHVSALAGTLIVNRANTPSLVGRTAYVDDDYPNLFLSDLLWRLSFRDIDPEFVYFYSKSKKYREAIKVMSVGASSTMKKIRFEDFARLEVPVLSAQEQATVVAELRRSQEVLRSTQLDIKKTLDLTHERRSALISAAVTGQIDVTQRHRPVAEQLEEEVLQNA